eukprot:ANDGO_04169.mRNA.1 DeSI-like protein At4g17486
MTHVKCNVYDIIDNSYSAWAGIGVFHSGIEVYGVEYSFGGGLGSATGVFGIEPRSAEGVVFRETVVLGETKLSRSEVERIVWDMARDWPSNSYDLLERNCNVFSDALAQRILGVGVPGFVNRLARVGSFFRCVLPAQLVGDQEPVRVNTSGNMVQIGGRVQGAATGPSVFQGTARTLQTAKEARANVHQRQDAASSSSSSAAAASASQTSSHSYPQPKNITPEMQREMILAATIARNQAARRPVGASSATSTRV